MKTTNSRSFLKNVFLVAIAIVTLASTPVQAGFHLWTIREVYTDSSGSLQFLELFDPSFGGQQFVGGFTLTVTDAGNTTTHSFTFPSNLPGDTFNHAMLLG